MDAQDLEHYRLMDWAELEELYREMEAFPLQEEDGLPWWLSPTPTPPPETPPAIDVSDVASGAGSEEDETDTEDEEAAQMEVIEISSSPEPSPEIIVVSSSPEPSPEIKVLCVVKKPRVEPDEDNHSSVRKELFLDDNEDDFFAPCHCLICLPPRSMD